MGKVIDKVNKLPNVTNKANPESTCRKVSFKTDISWGYEGCRSKIIKQTHCQGQCSSMFLPNGKPHFASCKSCTITKLRYKTVKLHCKDGIRKMAVGIAEECACQRCGVDFSNNIPRAPRKVRHEDSSNRCAYEKMKRLKRRRIELRNGRRNGKLKKKQKRKSGRKNRTRFNRCENNQKRKSKKSTKTVVKDKTVFNYIELMKLMKLVR